MASTHGLQRTWPPLQKHLQPQFSSPTLSLSSATPLHITHMPHSALRQSEAKFTWLKSLTRQIRQTIALMRTTATYITSLKFLLQKGLTGRNVTHDHPSLKTLPHLSPPCPALQPPLLSPPPAQPVPLLNTAINPTPKT